LGINAVTSLRRSLVAGLIQALVSRQRAAGAGSTLKRPIITNSADAGSTVGPALVSGGSVVNLSQGLYDARGLPAGVVQTGLSAGTSPPVVPTSTQRAESLSAADAKIDAGDISGGRKDAQELLAGNPDDVGALRVLARSYLGEHNVEQAQRYYARASSLDPDNEELKNELANVRALRRSDDEVLSAAHGKLKSHRERADGLRLLLHLSKRSPDNTEAHLALADAFGTLGQPLQVLKALHEAVGSADRDQIDQVITRAEAFVNDHPQVGLAHNVLGRALQKAGRLDEAIPELKAAASHNPNDFSYVTAVAEAYVARAQGELAAGNVISARSNLNAAQSIDPTNSALAKASAQLAAHQARLDIDNGRYNKALSELRTAVSKGPDDVRSKKDLAALYSRVAAHFLSKDANSAALSSYTKAYELDPTLAVARRYVGELSHAKGLSAIDAKDYDRAITHLDRAYRASRVNTTYRQDLAGAYDLRGQLRMRLGETAEAIEDFKMGFSLDPSNASLDANLSAALTQSNGT